jgi:hypothetical protein
VVRQLLGEQRASVGQRVSRTTTVAPSIERLRQKRSNVYLEALGSLDAGGTLVDATRLASLRDAIAAEFPPGQTLPLGWVAKCFLGAPFEVHTLDPSGEIARHFRGSEAMPPALERARSLARGGRYLFIEVYVDKLVAIAGDGTTSVLES